MELKSGAVVELHTRKGTFEIVGQWPGGGQWILTDIANGSELWVDVSEIKGAIY